MSSNELNENWQDYLKPILVEKIDEAMNSKEMEDILLPWIGNDCYRIMADAAITVLRGMEDMETYLKEEGYIDE